MSSAVSADVSHERNRKIAKGFGKVFKLISRCLRKLGTPAWGLAPRVSRRCHLNLRPCRSFRGDTLESQSGGKEALHEALRRHPQSIYWWSSWSLNFILHRAIYHVSCHISKSERWCSCSVNRACSKVAVKCRGRLDCRRNSKLVVREIIATAIATSHPR